MTCLQSRPEERELVDNRSGPRHRAVLLACRLVTARADDLCLVRDISVNGARAQTSLTTSVGEHVTLEFGNLCRLAGIVRWTRNGELGVEFDAPADLAPLIAGTGEPRPFDGWKRRRTDARRAFPRFRRCAVAGLSLHGLRHSGLLHDLSPAGAAIDLDPGSGLQVGDWVHCEIAGLAGRSATVRWTGPARVGVSFDIPLPLRLFDAWVVRTGGQCARCGDGRCPAPHFPPDSSFENPAL